MSPTFAYIIRWPVPTATKSVLLSTVEDNYLRVIFFSNCPLLFYYVRHKFELHFKGRGTCYGCSMKFCILLLVLVAIVNAKADKYVSKYDDVDIDRILQNSRVLTNYIKCVLDEGPCTTEGRELKSTIPDALTTECSKCNDKQKSTAEKVINFLRTKRPKDWERLSAKYDPNGVYEKRYKTYQSSKNV